MRTLSFEIKVWDSLEFWQHFCLNTFNSTMARTWRFASKELNNEFACSDLQRNLLSHKRIWNIILCCLWPMKNGLGLIKIWVKASRDALKVCFYVSLQMITFIFTWSYLIKVILFWINLRYWLKLLWEFLKPPVRYPIKDWITRACLFLRKALQIQGLQYWYSFMRLLSQAFTLF